MFIVCQEHGHVVWRRIGVDFCLVDVHHSIVGDVHVLGNRPPMQAPVRSDAESAQIAEKNVAGGSLFWCARLLLRLELWGE